MFKSFWSARENYTGVFIPEKKGICFFYTTWGQWAFACTSAGSEEFGTHTIATNLRTDGKMIYVSGSKGVCYINGESLPSTAGNRRYGQQPYPMIGDSYIGEIFSIRMYNRVLTKTERLANYEVDREKFG